MSAKYTISQAARKLGISRRSLYNWLQASDIEPGAAYYDGRVKTLSEAQLTRLAAKHGRQVKGIDVEALAAEVAALRARVAALEAWKAAHEEQPRQAEESGQCADPNAQPTG